MQQAATWPRAVAAGSAALCLLVAGCSAPGGTAAPSGGATAGNHPAATRNPAPGSAAAPSGRAVQGNHPAATGVPTPGLRDGDLGKGFQARLTPRGDRLDGATTFDNCGFRFTSEAHRTSRRQVAVLDQHGRDIGVTDEVVRYDSEEQATLAVTQWLTSVTGCHPGTVVPPQSGGPALRYEPGQGRTDPALPIRQNAETLSQVTRVPGSGSYLFCVLQRRGHVLDVVRASSPTVFTSDALTTVLALARTTGNHLAGLNG